MGQTFDDTINLYKEMGPLICHRGHDSTPLGSIQWHMMIFGALSISWKELTKMGQQDGFNTTETRGPYDRNLKNPDHFSAYVVETEFCLVLII